MARLTIFFKENQFITSKRSELYGGTDFMANVGGLLGLFMGVSILSLIEIIYYLTIRLACNLNLRRLYRNKLRRLSIPSNKDPLSGIVISLSKND
jgi:amiloride-sensitive sodium channel